MSDNKITQERAIKAYPKPPYKQLVAALARRDSTSESKIAALAIKELFDRMPHEEKKSLLMNIR